MNKTFEVTVIQSMHSGKVIPSNTAASSSRAGASLDGFASCPSLLAVDVPCMRRTGGSVSDAILLLGSPP